MTRVKASVAIWLLAILAVIVTIMDAPAQVADVQFNPNTGVIKEPSAGPTPAVQRAYAVTHTANTDYTVTAGVSLVEWNATTQSAQRSATLPDVGSANGSVPAGFLITVRIVSANSQNVNVLDFDANSLVIITTGAIYQFRAKMDGGWQITNMGFGTAAYFNTGTSGATIPLQSTANTFSETQTVSQAVSDGEVLSASVVSSSKASRLGIIGAFGGNFPGLWFLAPGSTPSTSNFAMLQGSADDTLFGAPAGGSIGFFIGGVENTRVSSAGVFNIQLGLKVGATGDTATLLRHDTATLSSGTVTVTATWVDADAEIYPQWDVESGTPGVRFSVTKSAGASFTITSKDASNATATGDNSTIYWHAIVD